MSTGGARLPLMTKPWIRPDPIPSATTATTAVPSEVGTSVAPRGVALISVTPSFNRTCSWYVPGATRTVSPERAAASASPMTLNCRPGPTTSTRCAATSGGLSSGVGIGKLPRNRKTAAVSSAPASAPSENATQGRASPPGRSSADAAASRADEAASRPPRVPQAAAKRGPAASTTLTLSLPPLASAARTSSSAARARSSGLERTISAISWLVTRSVSPSVQSSSASSGLMRKRETSTKSPSKGPWGPVPTER